jgi:hypothetical protein
MNQAEIFILIRNQSDAQLLQTSRMVRKDVTAYFHDGLDYDNSGFVTEGTIRVHEPYRVGILIIRAGDIALQFV